MRAAVRATCLLVSSIMVMALAGALIGGGIALAQSTQSSEGRPAVLRFLTSNDYPPFQFLDQDGSLTGFNVEIARGICRALETTCDIRVAPWEVLLERLMRNEADAVIASIKTTPRLLAHFDVTDRYYTTPARFAASVSLAVSEVTPETIEGRRIGVVRGTAHEAYLQAFFARSAIVPFDDTVQMRNALVSGLVDLVFDDGIGLSFWLLGTSSRGCCAFKGGPFLEPRYFGDGISIAINKGRPELKTDMNRALRSLRESGRYEEIASRSFPLKSN